MRKRLLLNTITSFGYQIIYAVYGLIFPRLILRAYGSQVNGLVQSVTQFLSVMALSEFGMTAVVQSSLYKPVVEHDILSISKILTSSDRFFRKIAGIFVVYIVTLCFVYPLFLQTTFSRVFVIQIIIILSINTLAEYILGISDRQLMTADQYIFLWNLSRMAALIISTLLSVFLIYRNASIQTVKLVTAITFLINPMVSFMFTKIKYSNVNKHEKYVVEPIKQKWNGVAQHISTYVYTSTDVIVLSLFSTLENVSVYATYYMILNGLSRLCTLFDGAIKPVLGNFWAKKDHNNFSRAFFLYEWGMHQLSVFVFGCASVLIVPFVEVYTRGIQDANYKVPAFAFLSTLASMFQIMKNVYHVAVQSIGGYKETQRYYVRTAVANVVISVFLVKPLGMVGVAIGTLVAVVYQIAVLVSYLYRNVFKQPIRQFVRLCLVDGIVCVLAYVSCELIYLRRLYYNSWFGLMIGCALIWGMVVLVVNVVFNRKWVGEWIRFCFR